MTWPAVHARRYQLHCILCGRDAPASAADHERCPRCGGNLFREPDEGPPLPAAVRLGRWADHRAAPAMKRLTTVK